MSPQRTRNRTDKDIAREFEPEAARIRAEAARQLELIQNPQPEPPTTRRPRMPPIIDPASRLLARRIETRRLAADWTRDQLAAEILEVAPGTTINAATLGRIERCERAVTVPELVDLATALSCQITDLIATGDICEACGQEIPK